MDRAVFDGRRCTGVRVSFSEGPWEDVAVREVVLCAGAIHSPAILMRSGIGPAAKLGALGVTTLHHHEGVGGNFMDHPMMRAPLALLPEHRAKEPDARHTNCCVTYSSGLAGGGFRDMILIGYNHRVFTGAGVSPFGGIGASIFEAFSRGSVRLASADPQVQPQVEEGLLDDERDRVRMRDAVARLAVLAAHPAVAGICDRVGIGEAALTLADAAALPPNELDAVLLAEVGDSQHAAGTCAMSAYEDPRGVVDPDLRVRGVTGLRVADASVMPTDCRANLHFTCVMIGENLARRMR